MSLQPPALLREGGGEALRALGSSLGNHFANTTRRGQEIADVVEQSLRSSSPMKALVSQVAAGAEWVASSRGRDEKKEEVEDAGVEAAAAALLDEVKATSTQAAAAGWVTTEMPAVDARLDAFLFACLRSTGGDLDRVGELLARCVCEMEEEELGRDRLVYASGSWQATLRAWLRLELLRATDTSIHSQEEREGRFEALGAIVDKEDLTGTGPGRLVWLRRALGGRRIVFLFTFIFPDSHQYSHPYKHYIDLQPRRILRHIPKSLDKLASLASTSIFCLPLDLPLHQSLPICLSSSATTQEGQIAAAASGSAAVVVAAAPAAVVAFVTIAVRGAGLEHGKKKEEANICLYSLINVPI